MRALGVALVAVWALACAAACPAAAQDDLAGISYIDPFPPGDTYKLQAYGDAFAEGLTTGLVESMASETRVQVQRKHRALTGIARAEFDEEVRGEEGQAREPVHIAVIMIGYGDRIPIRLQSSGRRVAINSDEWRDEYGRRVERLIKALKKQGVALYWIGLPILRRAEANEDAQRINDIVREKAYLNSIKFIDIQSQFADEAGNYTPYGPDLTGKSRLLRDSDGIIFTLAGFQKLAHFVEQEIKRDLLQARNERAIPLAGNDTEQKRIAGLRPKPAEGDGGWKGTVNAAKDGKAAQQKAGGASSAAGQIQAEAEQKADNGRITLKSVGAGGREEAVTLDLPRPTIPQAVILLMTRKESTERASQVGDALPEDVGGGLVVLNSISPTGSAGGAARRLAPSQTPYYHVLVKGERVIPKPGRADDFSWPKVEDAAADTTPTTGQPIRRIPRLPRS